MSKDVIHSSTSDFLRRLTDLTSLVADSDSLRRLEILLADFLACSLGAINTKPTFDSTLSLDGIIGKSAWLALNVNQNDQDDIDWTVGTHPGSIIWSTALAVTLINEESRDHFIKAALAGYRTLASVATFFGAVHRGKWHVTATAGAFASATTAAILLNLSTEQHFQALHLVGANMGGSVLAPRDRSGAAGFNRSAATALGVTSVMAVQAGAQHVSDPWDGPVGVCELFEIARDLKSAERLPDGVSTTSLRLFPVTGFAQAAVLAAANLSARNSWDLHRLDVGVSGVAIPYLDGTRGGDWWDVRSAVASAWRSKNPTILATANELKRMVHVSAIDIPMGGARIIASTDKGEDREIILSAPGGDFNDRDEVRWRTTKWSRLVGAKVESMREVSTNLVMGNNAPQIWQQLGQFLKK